MVQILSPSSATLVIRSWLCEPSKPRNYGKTQHFAHVLPAKISHVAYLCCKTSLLSNIDAARPSGRFQYSRKLELLTFLWKKNIYIYIQIFLNELHPLTGMMLIFDFDSLIFFKWFQATGQDGLFSGVLMYDRIDIPYHTMFLGNDHLEGLTLIQLQTSSPDSRNGQYHSVNYFVRG